MGLRYREGKEDRAHILKRKKTNIKHSITILPNNPAAWNYLLGILQHKHIAQPFSSIKESSIILYTTVQSPLSPGSERNIVDLENPLPGEGAATLELPVPAAIGFMADIWEMEGTKEWLDKASELWKPLANQHDTVRKKYWEYRIRDARSNMKADS